MTTFDLSQLDAVPTIADDTNDLRGRHGLRVDRRSWTVRTAEPVSYEVRVCPDLLDPASTDLLAPADVTTGGHRRVVVVDETVDEAHGDRIRAWFDHHGVDARYTIIDAHETEKHMKAVETVVRAMDDAGVARRHEPVIAIGGGVLTDIVGLAASLYRRGTPFVRVPTTLIGLVDASVGAKTGVNFDGHKNRLGTYFPARVTLLDRTFLGTVGRRHIANGLGEILKIALVKDAHLFDLLARHGAGLLDDRFQGSACGGAGVGDEVIVRAIHGMLEELQPNLWEATLERTVDYGHTFSPTVEMRALPTLLHGEAVSVDMALTTVMAQRRGLVDEHERARIFATMDALELPRWNDHLDPDVLIDALRDTVRHRDGLQRLPLPVGIGDVTFVNDVDAAELHAAVARLRSLA